MVVPCGRAVPGRRTARPLRVMSRAVPASPPSQTVAVNPLAVPDGEDAEGAGVSEQVILQALN